MSDLFSFRGKLARKEYISVSIGLLIMNFLLRLPSFASFDAGLAALFGIFSAVIFVAATIKRLRDIGLPSAWAWLCIVPLANVVLVLVLMARPSKGRF